MTFLQRLLLVLGSSFILTGCAYLRIDPMHPLLRSASINTPEQYDEVLSRASLSWTADGRIRVLKVSGTAYERGFQQGVLLRPEVQANLGYLFSQARKIYYSEELFAESYERMRPFIPQEYIDEMHGLAHGAKLPLNLVHYIHALPEMSEWGGKGKLKGVIKQMMDGELGTSCSNICAAGSSTSDNQIYSVRVLNWGLHKISRLHDYPLITINIAENEIPHANIGWVGFLGAVSGMNAQGITLGEMGYGSPPNETLAGKPMIFLLREVLAKSRNLEDVRQLIGESVGTNSYIYVMSDGKTASGELYVKDRDRFMHFPSGKALIDKDRDKHFPAIPDLVYGGHYDQIMAEKLIEHHGQLSPELFMNEIIPAIAMKSNFHNVVYDPKNLYFWVSNAAAKDKPATGQPYTFFDFAEALGKAL